MQVWSTNNFQGKKVIAPYAYLILVEHYDHYPGQHKFLPFTRVTDMQFVTFALLHQICRISVVLNNDQVNHEIVNNAVAYTTTSMLV